ncbi:hypothetical protein GCM10010387_43660 [Streptomyces inusitatus]|uniref:Uncharacterized protein n=1 Tax=Streptomyces inusitatus TaxID=68221 RepID=A0A918QFP8_9ACTN|nr:hypothetical protein [Streptomyces inusitatus]GGZ44654.1 hypothetical protein GCM10010387_43660 [Streptomyces inusitatus]
MPRTPAKRTPGPAGGGEVVEIRLIARDGIAQALAAQIADSIPGCPPPRIYPSRKTPGQMRAYIKATLPAHTVAALENPQK